MDDLALQFMRYAHLPARVLYQSPTGLDCRANLVTAVTALAPAYRLFAGDQPVGMAVLPSNLPNVEIYLLERLMMASHAVAGQG